MSLTSKLDQPIITNGFVSCYADHLVIHLYYFPYGDKKVKYSNLRSCELHQADDLDMFTQKLWGMSLSPIWWHCDMKRYARKYYIVLDANQWPQIGLTMDDTDTLRVYNFIQKKMQENQMEMPPPPYEASKGISEKDVKYRQSVHNGEKR